MIEYEEAFGAERSTPKILTPRLMEGFDIKEGRTPDEAHEKLLTELRLKLTQVNPDITPTQMVCSIQDTLELSDDELRRIIPEGSSEVHISNSFLSIWYMASTYPDGTFAQYMREKHPHKSYKNTDPASHLELMMTEGVGPVLMEHYRIFNDSQFPTAEPSPRSPVR